MRKLLTPRNITIIVVVLVAMIGSAVLLKVPLPSIVLPAEAIFKLGPFTVTNTIIATIIVDILVVLLAVLTSRKMKDVPGGLQNMMEWFVEIFYNLNEDIAGKKMVKKLFPIFMTILIFILVSNWMGLVPGVDSIGKLEPLEEAYKIAGVATGYRVKDLPFGIQTLTRNEEPYTLSNVEKKALDAEAAAEEAHGTEGDTEVHHVSKLGYYVLSPYVRPPATDLNVPLAIALISVVWTQIIGVQALGGSYFRKFFLPNMTGMVVIDLFVGILELISEIAKIISFTFRLFGNVFAGAVLLFVMTFLVPFLIPLPFYGLEVFVGFMQAFVFAILTLIFMSMAVVGHGPDSDHH